MKILLVPKQNDICIKAAQKLELVLQEEHEIIYDSTTAARLKKPCSRIEDFRGDIIITLGGDGTLLYAAPKTEIPILPLRVEGFGFLTTADFEEVLSNPEMLDEMKIVEKQRLEIEGIDAPPAANEIILVREVPSKIISINFSIDETSFSFKGDGIIFATPSGSTAYSLSAGGAVIDTSLDTIELVPIFPFNSKIRPMVIPGEKRIELSVETGLIIVDGSWEKKVENARLVIRKGRPMKIACFGENFYSKYGQRFLS